MRLSRSAFLAAAAVRGGSHKRPRKGPSFLSGLLRSLGGLRRLLSLSTRAGQPRPGLHPNWGVHVPDMARSGAEMMESSAHFDKLPFGGEDLAEGVANLAKLEEAREQVEAISQDLGDRITEQKNILAEQVTQLRQSIDAMAQNPQTDADVRADVITVSAKFRRIYKDAVQAGQQSRSRTLKARAATSETIASVEADRDRAVLENEVLRGGSIRAERPASEQPPLAARRAARRAARKTPR